MGALILLLGSGRCVACLCSSLSLWFAGVCGELCRMPHAYSALIDIEYISAKRILDFIG